MSDAAPAVSVCIRAFARPEGLRTAIRSVLAQSFQDFEVVVSDDSGDMAAVVEAFSDPRVRYHRNPRPDGQVANIVTSLGLARGRYLALLDDDDHWLPGFLDATVGVLERDPEIGIAFTDLYFEAGGRRLRRRATLAPGRQEGMLARILEDCPVVMSAAVMRREVWEQGQREYPLEAGAVGDFTMWIRAALAGCGFHYVDESLACYALHPAQLSWDPRAQRRAIRLFERFEFEDPRCERLRRARLANARLATAGSHLWRGRLREARREIALARGVAPGRLGLRGWLAVSGTRPALVRLVASSPAVLMFVLRLWRALRPRVDPGARPQLERLLAGVEGWLGMREARALHDAAFRLARADAGLVAVEIGSWKGRSAIAIASGLERAGGGVLYAVDPHEGSRPHALKGAANTAAAFQATVRQAGVEHRVRPLIEISAKARGRFEDGTVGLLFIDGSHLYEDVVDDIRGWLPRLRDGATVAFHDAHMPSVRRALLDTVLGNGAGFDQPRAVQGTLFVTRSVAAGARSPWRGHLLLQQARIRPALTAAVAPLRRRVFSGADGPANLPSAPEGPRSRMRPAKHPRC